MKSAQFAGAAALLFGALPGCGSTPQAVGNVNSIIVITSDSLWRAVGDSLRTALERPIFTVRQEPTFHVTQVSPQDPRWTKAREFRHVVVIGGAADGWIAPVLRRARKSARNGERAGRTSGPALVQTRDVWARNQFATALVLPAAGAAAGAGAAAAALALAPRAATATDSVFRAYARERMYLSRPDTTLRDSLRRRAGYGILLPNVYFAVRRAADVQLFQNTTQIGGDLVRSVLIVARPGLIEPTAETALAWRDSVARTHYRPAHDTQREQVRATHVQAGGHAAIELQGVWQGTDSKWPMAGPFITRMVPCPAQNRTFLVDSWLYAPAPQRGSRYEYIIQLQTILESFECGSAEHTT
jgi:hypothetical protein